MSWDNDKLDIWATYTPKEMRSLFKDFGNKVNSHKYRAMPYADWKKLNNHLSATANSTSACYGVGMYDGELSVTCDCPQLDMIFDVDSGFAEYFWNEVFDEESWWYDDCGCAHTDKPVEQKKENESMMNGLKFEFGPCTNDNVKISMYGLAIRNNAGTWVSYNRTSGEIVDVDIFNFDGGNFLFKMPVALKEVKIGDIVIHNKVPVFVTAVEEGKLIAVDVRAGEEKSIIPTKNMFGFDFITKVVSVLDAVQGAPTPNEPFGNMLPFLMLQDGKMDKNMALMLMMNQGNNVFANNPMMLYFMMSNDGKDCDMLPLMLMMNGGFAAPAASKTPVAE